ncbi:VOC family protein [Paracoccus pacificus]|uniref:VOC family protein n=1 Tax=Paracoccus pacificus TaxID=1463598 RepID=A0ABW4R8L8_9RHOB
MTGAEAAGPRVGIGAIVWGVRDMNRAIAFWSAALGYELRRAPDDDFAILVPANGAAGTQLSLKLTSSAAPRRHHMDLFTTDQASEVARLIALGARRVAWRYEPDADYVVLADPEGNSFCVVNVEEAA